MTTNLNHGPDPFRLIEHASYDGHPTWVAVFCCRACGYRETAFLTAGAKRYPCFVCGESHDVPVLPVSL